MHACGHDAHAASLLGACRILVNHKDDIYGKIVINFQQAEEIGYGARQFIDRGLVKNVDRTFGMHVASAIETGYISLTPGPNNASVDWFKIKVRVKQLMFQHLMQELMLYISLHKLYVIFRELLQDFHLQWIMF